MELLFFSPGPSCSGSLFPPSRRLRTIPQPPPTPYLPASAAFQAYSEELWGPSLSSLAHQPPHHTMAQISCLTALVLFSLLPPNVKPKGLVCLPTAIKKLFLYRVPLCCDLHPSFQLSCHWLCWPPRCSEYKAEVFMRSSLQGWQVLRKGTTCNAGERRGKGKGREGRTAASKKDKARFWSVHVPPPKKGMRSLSTAYSKWQASYATRGISRSQPPAAFWEEEKCRKSSFALKRCRTYYVKGRSSGPSQQHSACEIFKKDNIFNIFNC